jgi:hypothetical protein
MITQDTRTRIPSAVFVFLTWLLRPLTRNQYGATPAFFSIPRNPHSFLTFQAHNREKSAVVRSLYAELIPCSHQNIELVHSMSRINLRIREILGSNLGLETEYSDLIFGFLHS